MTTTNDDMTRLLEAIAPAAPSADPSVAAIAAAAPVPAAGTPQACDLFADISAPVATPAVFAEPTPIAAAAAAAAVEPSRDWAAELDARDTAMRRMQDTLVQREQELAYARGVVDAATLNAPAPAAPAAYDHTADELTADERATYEAALPTVQKIVNAAVRKHHESSVLPALDQVRAAHETARAATAATDAMRGQMFATQIATKHPELADIIATPAWQAHLKAPSLVHGGAPLSAVIEGALHRHDMVTISAIIQDYTSKRAPKPAAPTPTLPAGGAGVAPMTSAPQANALRAISDSKLDALVQARQAGKMDESSYESALAQAFASAAAGAPLTA